MTGDDSDQANDERATEQLKLVYLDLSQRLANDNDVSWKIVTPSGVLLALLGTFIAQAHPVGVLVKVLASVSASCLLVAIVYGFVSLLVYRDLRRLKVKYIPGADSPEFQTMLGPNSGGLFESLFHTSSILKGGNQASERDDYRRRLRDYFDRHLTDYVFFLANLIEIKRRPRFWSLMFMLTGSLLVGATVVAKILTS